MTSSKSSKNAGDTLPTATPKETKRDGQDRDMAGTVDVITAAAITPDSAESGRLREINHYEAGASPRKQQSLGDGRGKKMGEV